MHVRRWHVWGCSEINSWVGWVGGDLGVCVRDGLGSGGGRACRGGVVDVDAGGCGEGCGGVREGSCDMCG